MSIAHFIVEVKASRANNFTSSTLLPSCNGHKVNISTEGMSLPMGEQQMIGQYSPTCPEIEMELELLKGLQFHQPTSPLRPLVLHLAALR
ncbi:Hydrogenase maturation factor HypA [Frankliniella fusca]|uniref:Hydrogenase maturation factor HypA n=1 Tax=Frankliniella fusca TaxID=407009 RepID=A0AAE1H864_9NEOP|nr:Hydrogenase maturation factor HypA [Frankliniella fusca]